MLQQVLLRVLHVLLRVPHMLRILPRVLRVLSAVLRTLRIVLHALLVLLRLVRGAWRAVLFMRARTPALHAERLDRRGRAVLRAGPRSEPQPLILHPKLCISIPSILSVLTQRSLLRSRRGQRRALGVAPHCCELRTSR